MAEPTKRKAVSRAFLVATVCAVAIPLAWNYWLRKPEEKPFAFPFVELAALDRDAQTRFAVVPEKDFGLERIGPLHNLYSPENPTEFATVAALKKRNLDVAF